jgi:hypothetical protein
MREAKIRIDDLSDLAARLEAFVLADVELKA